MLASSIWFDETPDLAKFNSVRDGTLVATLGIVVTEVGADYLRGTMPVDDRTRQPFGLLHGGASVSLAESLGSMAANLVLDSDKQYGVGLEINANHLKSVSSGIVIGTAKAVHIGKKTQVWEIRIENERGQLTCISRLTVAILDK